MSQFFASGGQSIETSVSASFRLNWLDLFAVQATLKSLLQHRSSNASVLRCSAFFIVRFSHPYMTTGKTIALTRRNIVGKVMSLLFNINVSAHLLEWPKSRTLTSPNVGEDGEKQEPSFTLVETQKGAATLEDSFAYSYHTV